MSMTLGIVFALACSLVTNVGFLCKHRGACAAPAVDVRRPLGSLRALLSSGWFALGMAVAGSAWVFQIAALAFAPVSIVQVVLAGGVVLLAVTAERFFGCAVGARQRICLALTAGGLVLIVATLPATSGRGDGVAPAGLLGFQATLLVVAGALVAGACSSRGRAHAGLMLGAAAGTLFAVSDVALKALLDPLADGGGAELTPRRCWWRSSRRWWPSTPRPARCSGGRGGAGDRADRRGRQRGQHRRRVYRLRRPRAAGTVAAFALMLGFASVCVAALLTPAPLRVAPAAV